MSVPPPLASLSALVVAGSLLVDVARTDGSGRVSARYLLAALGWGPGHRVDVDIADGVLHIGSVASGTHMVDSRGELGVPTAARRMCGIGVGPPVLLIADPLRHLLLVHPSAWWLTCCLPGAPWPRVDVVTVADPVQVARRGTTVRPLVAGRP